jgi:hypothetical protein
LCSQCGFLSCPPSTPGDLSARPRGGGVFLLCLSDTRDSVPASRHFFWHFFPAPPRPRRPFGAAQGRWGFPSLPFLTLGRHRLARTPSSGERTPQARAITMKGYITGLQERHPVVKNSPSPCDNLTVISPACKNTIHLFATPVRHTWLPHLVATPGCHPWLPPPVATIGCHSWLPRLVATPGCHSWLPHLFATPGCLNWLPLLVATPGCHSWLPHLVATPGCHTWLPHVVDPPWFPHPGRPTWLPLLVATHGCHPGCHTCLPLLVGGADYAY